MTFTTVQESFWAGEFGNEYTGRNADAKLTGNIALFARILSKAPGVRSVLELGANRGNNLRAIKTLLPEVEMSAVEINRTAFEQLRTLPGVDAVNGSILDYRPTRQFDMVLLKGVLIHIEPGQLQRVYATAFGCARKYVCLCEYYNPTPMEVEYRGHSGKLFKRDFAGEMLDRFPLRLVDYGFVYHRDVFPLGDCTWFLMERTGSA